VFSEETYLVADYPGLVEGDRYEVELACWLSIVGVIGGYWAFGKETP
jgi:hypothetical protein